MTGNIVGEPIVEAIDKQIDYRQQIHGAGYIPGTQNLQRTPEVQNYLNNRNSWIKMASGVSLSGSAAVEKIKALSSDESNYLSNDDETAMQGEGLAKGLVLFNGTQKFNTAEITDKDGNVTTPKNSYTKRSGAINSYDFLNNSNKMYGGLGSSQRGLQPVPGIIDMSVECLNRGSIRKATVTLKAYNKFQFGLIELLYLRLGYSVMLEWGWDKYIDEITPGKNAITPPIVKIKEMESTIIENQWFDGKDYSQTNMINLVLANEERFKGNYGGFFGKVSNFSWTLNADNTYDITLNLITMGSVIESLNIKIPTTSVDKNSLKQIRSKLSKKLDLNTDDSDNTILSNVGSDKLSQWISTTILNFEVIKGNYIKTLDYILGEDLIGVEKANEAPYKTLWRNNIPLESKYFVRFETFLSKLQELAIVNIINGSTSNDSELSFEIDPEVVRCNYETNLVPLNANKVIFSVLMEDEFLKKINDVSGISSRPIEDMNANMAKFATKEDGVIYGKLLNCYLNLTFIQQAFVDSQNNKEEVGLFEFLQKICDGINESTGNCTDLEVVLKKDKTVVIIDQNQIKGGDKLIKNYVEKTAINIYGYEPQGSSSFVKDFKFQTKITPNLMNMVTIGSTASDEKDINAIPFKKWNKGLVNRFGQSQEYNQEVLTNQEKTDKSNEEFKKAFSEAIEDNEASYKSGFGYKFKYGEIYLSDIWAEGVSFLPGNRPTDAKNEGLLSVALNQYKRKLKSYNKKYQIGDPNSKILTNSAEAENNYLIYLTSAFGGNSGFSLLKSNTATKTIYQVQQSKLRQNGMFFKWDNNDFIQQGKNSFKKYLSNINKKEAEASTPIISGTGFIPLELSITMDGLSGVKIYNRLKINTKFLPSSYPENLKFIVKGVNHKVSNNVWDTNISTISVPVSITPPTKKIIFSGSYADYLTSDIFITGNDLYRTNLILNPPTNKARQIAEAYLGRVMTDEEWYNLVAATAAEASANEEERAYVMAVMINRARSKDIFSILTAKNQFQAVTGTNANKRQPSPNFTNATQTTANAIFKGVEKYLAEVPKNFKYFTAAADAAYGPGTDISFRNNMLAKGGKTIGGKNGTVFGTII